MKKILSVLLCIVLVLTLIPSFSLVANAEKNGKIGECTWTLNGTELTISGNGAMTADYDVQDCPMPWGTDITKVTIENGVTNIGIGAFNGCKDLTSVTISNSVTRIGSSAFFGCINLVSINIPDSVTSIGIDAFSGCTGLTSIIIPDSVTSIESFAFYGCIGLKSVTIGNSVTAIGENAFEGCTGLTRVNYTGDIASWCNISFDDNDANPLSYAHHLYINDKEVKNLAIIDGVTSINNYAFSGCTGLTSITIGNSVTSIGWYTFYNCSGLTRVTLGKSVTSICYSAFGGCNELINVYYYGTKADWEKITISSKNEELLNANIHFKDNTSGDASGDGVIDVKDLTCLKKYFSDKAHNEIGLGADCTGDGKVDAKDLTRLKKYLADKEHTVLGKIK